MQVKEIIYPLGATIDVRAIRLGDETMSVLEIWGAEYQENDCLLIRAADRGLLEGICARERALMQVFPGRRQPPVMHLLCIPWPNSLELQPQHVPGSLPCRASKSCIASTPEPTM